MFQNLKDLVYGLMPIQKRFERINSRNQWGNDESVSGIGSTMANTENIRAVLPDIFEELGVKKVIDIACGDFNWMSQVVANTGVEYKGFDIVPGRLPRTPNAMARIASALTSSISLRAFPPKAATS